MLQKVLGKKRWDADGCDEITSTRFVCRMEQTDLEAQLKGPSRGRGALAQTGIVPASSFWIPRHFDVMYMV
jgi:hypothetical protein